MPQFCLHPLAGWGTGAGVKGQVAPSLAPPARREVPTLCRFFSRGGRLSRIIFMALRGGSLK